MIILTIKQENNYYHKIHKYTAGHNPKYIF